MADDESKGERLDRELMELLQELRVVLPGVQVLLAFLLTAPFQQRFASLPGSLRNAFFASIVCATLATVLLIAPSAHHRLRWRAGEKERLLRIGNQMALWGTVFLATLTAVMGLTRVRKHRGGLPGWSPVQRKILVTVLPPFIAAAGLTAILAWRWWSQGADDGVSRRRRARSSPDTSRR